MPKDTHSDNFGTLETKGFQIEFLSHAKAIFEVDFPDAVKQICDVLSGVTIPIEEIIAECAQKTTYMLAQKAMETEAARSFTFFVCIIISTFVLCIIIKVSCASF